MSVTGKGGVGIPIILLHDAEVSAGGMEMYCYPTHERASRYFLFCVHALEDV
jgi:hypothetical protein